MSLLSVKRLRYLDNGPYTFHVDANEVIGISGPSGIGKTQLLRALVQCILYQGEVEYKGVPAENYPAPLWRQMIGLVPAEPLWWYERVADHYPADNIERIEAILTALGFEPEVVHWETSRLSSGEKQRLAIARALLLNPSILLLDEPGSALDEHAVSLVEKCLLDYSGRQDTALVWVSHDSEQLERVASRSFTMLRNQLVPLGSGLRNNMKS